MLNTQTVRHTWCTQKLQWLLVIKLMQIIRQEVKTERASDGKKRDEGRIMGRQTQSTDLLLDVNQPVSQPIHSSPNKLFFLYSNSN